MLVNRLKAMFGQQLQTDGLGKDKPVSSYLKVFSNTHWIKLPDVKSFKVIVSDWHSLFKFFGILKRNPPKIEWEPHKNKRANIYMSKQVKRLRKLKHRPSDFFYIVRFLMIKSSSFRVSAINKTFPRWYKELPLSYIMKINRKVNNLILTFATDLDFKRVYIPKGDTYRPLGVPAPEWRIYQQLLNNFLYIFLEDKFLPDQHGFIPGKGTLTAW